MLTLNTPTRDLWRLILRLGYVMNTYNKIISTPLMLETLRENTTEKKLMKKWKESVQNIYSF